MGVWWEGMLAAGTGFVGAAEPSRAASWWNGPRADWADYRRGFRIRGSERDPLNALHRLAFQHMFSPAWEATPNPIVCRFTGRALLRYAQSTWRRPDAFTPSRTLAVLEQAVRRPEPSRPAIVLTDPTDARRAQLILPQHLEHRGQSVRVRDFSAEGSTHVLELDPAAETWAYTDGNGTNWRGGEDRGRLVLLPPQLMARDPLPFVEPVTEAEDDAPISLAILSGSALFPIAPDEAPWWLLSGDHHVLPRGYLHRTAAGRPISAVLQVTGAYEYCFLETGRGMVWRGEGTGWDLTRVERKDRGLQFSIRTDGGRRWGSLELIQTNAERQSVRAFRLQRLELAPGSYLDVSLSCQADELTVRNRSRHSMVVGLEIEAGWAAGGQRRRLPGLRLDADETVRIRPVRWQALGLGPIDVVCETFKHQA